MSKFNNTIKTKYNEIGDDSPVYIIAEIGSNHNGDFNLAKEMIDKAKDAGVNEDEIIISISDNEITSMANISKALENKNPGNTIVLKTDKSEYNIILGENPNNASRPYLGTYLEPQIEVKEALRQKYKFLPDVFLWIVGLFFWIQALNLGIGLFNLVPLGPIDGGRMLQVTLHKFIKDKNKADFIWKRISLLFLGLLIAILVVRFFV